MSGKKQRRISRSATIYVPVAAFLIVFFGILGISAFLKIMSIEVTGASVHSKEEIISASGIVQGDNMLWVNVQNAEQSIRDAIPMINEVGISRLFPDRIVIEVKESKAIAVLRHQGEMYIIDYDGRVLEQTSAVPRGLIEIRGFVPVEPAEGSMLRAEPGGGMRLQFMTDVLKAIDDAGITRDVSFLDVTRISAISFGYDERFIILIGAPDGARSKINQLPSYLPALIAKAQAEDPSFDITATYQVDMSDPSGEWWLRPA